MQPVGPSTVSVADPTLPQMLTKLYEDQLQYEKLKGTMGENNPTTIQVKTEIDRIKPSICRICKVVATTLSYENLNTQTTTIPLSWVQFRRRKRHNSNNPQHNIESNNYDFCCKSSKKPIYPGCLP
jgi:hypothetical protein